MMQPRDPEIIQSAIIGCLINWPSEIDLVSSHLQPEDFISNKHRDCYIWMLENQGAGFDLVTIAHSLNGKVHAAELSEWSFIEATSAFLPRYCHELKEVRNRICLHNLATEARTLCSQDKPCEEIKEHIEAGLARICATRGNTTAKTAKELALATVRRIEDRYERKGELQGIPYGWSDLDAKTNGMHRGELIIIAGRPSMGKSAFAGNVLTFATANGYSGILFNLEMGSGETMDRLTAAKAHISYDRIRSGTLEGADWERLTKACGQLAAQRLMIDDTPSLSLADLRSRCRKIKAETGLDFAIVDYLQLIKLSSRENRVQAIGEISRGLKLLARELDIAVMALSQLSRAVDSRPDKRPTMSDLRDSGEIEQDADVILFPFRPAAYCEKCRDRKEDTDHSTERHQKVAEIIIEKQRNGQRNISVPMVWHGKYQRFDLHRRDT